MSELDISSSDAKARTSSRCGKSPIQITGIASIYARSKTHGYHYTWHSTLFPLAQTLELDIL